ncbi:MAG: hypothetical protein ACK4FL_01390 [Microgenomates group bacterium]
MDISNLLFSVNKISFIAFIITGFLVAYQIYLIKKETLTKNKPRIPEFKEEIKIRDKDGNVFINTEEKKKPVKKARKISLIITTMVFVFFGLLIILSGTFKFNGEKLRTNPITTTPIINFIASSGIKIYNQNWTELTDNQLMNLKPGSTIYIGIETVADADIDKARIRVNKQYWDNQDITVNFNKERKVFYREYIIASDEAMLKIEGQLHSKTDGWLGE